MNELLEDELTITPTQEPTKKGKRTDIPELKKNTCTLITHAFELLISYI